MARQLIFEYALHQDPDTGRLSSYWPDYWPVERLIDERESLGPAFFAAGYQNDPTSFEGNLLAMEWVNYYDRTELETYRAQAGIQPGFTGTIHAGVDPSGGGSVGDTDNCAIVVGERIGAYTFLVGFYMKRMRVELQAQEIEDYLSLWNPAFVFIEDVAKKGYVWRDFTTQINGGAGTKFHVDIKNPQSNAAMGNKESRFLSMAPRFARGQVRVPGIVSHATQRESGQFSIHPDWEPWLNQWRSFPAGHDDALDATYWMLTSAYLAEPGSSASKLPPELDPSSKFPDIPPLTSLCASPAHLAFRQHLTIEHCPRCLINRQEQVNRGRELLTELGEMPNRTIGQKRPRRARSRMLR